MGGVKGSSPNYLQSIFLEIKIKTAACISVITSGRHFLFIFALPVWRGNWAPIQWESLRGWGCVLRLQILHLNLFMKTIKVLKSNFYTLMVLLSLTEPGLTLALWILYYTEFHQNSPHGSGSILLTDRWMQSPQWKLIFQWREMHQSLGLEPSGFKKAVEMSL